jgi:hypothetical protein
MKLNGLVPNFFIHVSVSDLYVPTIGPPILPYCVCGPIVGIYKLLTAKRPCSSISGNISFEFSVQYTVQTTEYGTQLFVMSHTEVQRI